MNPPVLYDAIGARLTDAEFRALVALHGAEMLTQALLHLRAVVLASTNCMAGASTIQLDCELRRARVFLAQHTMQTEAR